MIFERISSSNVRRSSERDVDFFFFLVGKKFSFCGNKNTAVFLYKVLLFLYDRVYVDVRKYTNEN